MCINKNQILREVFEHPKHPPVNFPDEHVKWTKHISMLPNSTIEEMFFTFLKGLEFGNIVDIKI